MTKNLSVVDIKPQNELVVDIKPQNELALDVKPNNDLIANDFGTERYFDVTINAGQSMGLLLALTYRTGFTVSSPKTR